jgi:hypothetical protein
VTIVEVRPLGFVNTDQKENENMTRNVCISVTLQRLPSRQASALPRGMNN